MFSLLGKARDAGLGARASGGSATAATSELSAAELASGLSGLGKAALGGGKTGSSARALKAAVRAVHIYPGEATAWRCVAAALVSAQGVRIRGHFDVGLEKCEQ